MSAAWTNECRKTTIISMVNSRSYFKQKKRSRKGKSTDWVDLIHRRENDFVTSTHADSLSPFHTRIRETTERLMLSLCPSNNFPNQV